MPLGVVAANGAVNRLTIRYVEPPNEGSNGNAASASFAVNLDGNALASFDDTDADGITDVVVWEAVPGEEGRKGVVAVYRLAPGHPLTPLARLTLPGRNRISSRSNLVIADVDRSVAGNEVIVGSVNRGLRLTVLGGVADGRFRVLHRFRALRRRASNRGHVGFAVGDVLPDSEHAGKEIIAGGRGGFVRLYVVDDGRVRVFPAFRAFPDPPRASAERLAAGDLLPDHPGDEIAVGDDGTRADGVVRILDGREGRIMSEFEAFDPTDAPAGVELWAADVLPQFPGAELIVGQGPTGGQLRVFTLASGVPRHVADLPDALHRRTSLRRHLAIGDLFPEVPGNEIAVAQGEPMMPIQIYSFDPSRAEFNAVATVPNEAGTVAAIAAGT